VALNDWLKRFTELHRRAREGAALSPAETRSYIEGRNDLATAILRAQQIALRPGQKPRQALRANTVLPVTVVMPEGPLKALTQDLSIGGFSAIVGRIGTAPAHVDFSLTLAKGTPPIEGPARLVAEAPMGGSTRLSFAFERVTAADVERIELVVFDWILAQIAPPG
jgi:hypothetical protein